MSRRDTLGTNIKQSERLISEYETIARESDRPEEKMRAGRILAEQRELIRGHLEEYLRISNQLGEPLSADLRELAATYGLADAGPRAIRIFYSYAREDEKLRERLEAHLSSMRREGMIEEWHDRRIVPGQKWADEIDQNLEAADIILLLVSPSFVASDYCWSKETKRAMERHEEGTAAVIPVILRPVDWQTLPFGQLQALPRDGKPVTGWSDRDEAFLDVAQGLRRAVAELG
jgi:hypothetical protein